MSISNNARKCLKQFIISHAVQNYIQCWFQLQNKLLLGEEAEASLSIGNTLWRVWTTFTRSAITLPEVNGFRWNLGHSEYTVWSRPWQILGAISAEARAGRFFCPVNNARLYRFPLGQISRNLHTRRGSCDVVNHFVTKFSKSAGKGSLFYKTHFSIPANDFRHHRAITP